ncbi:MAG: PorV/PorQ family protein [Spirochaetes bacterium]|nr:PorV/PorQ family protein [Spirochaetota bacterium]
MFKNRVLITVLSLIILTIPLHAIDVGNGAEILKVYPSAKGNALAGALTADQGLNAMFYNPAGLADTDIFFTKGVGLFYGSLNEHNLMHGAVNAYYDIENLGVFGLSVLYNDNGDIPLFSLDASGTVTDTGSSFNARDIVTRIIFAKSFLEERLLLGIGALALSSTIESYSAFGFGADIGIQYLSLIPNLNLGLSVKNIGTGLKFINESSSFPMSINFGVKYVIFDESKVVNNALIAYLNSTYYMKEETQFGISGGLELRLVRMIFIRGGYNYQKDNLYSLSVGGGIKYLLGSFRPELDVSYLPQKEFGNKLNVGFLLYF